MERVAVVGASGAGKSTFARALASRTSLPLIHLDEHFWKPGWVESSPDDWHERQRQLISGPRWIVDGNYGGSLDIRLASADTVFVFGLHRLRCLYGAVRRSIVHRGVAVQAPGCPERITAEFAKYIWNYPAQGRPRLDARLANHLGTLRIIEFRSHADVAGYLDDYDRRQR